MLAILLEALIKVGIVLGVLMGLTGFMVIVERKFSSFMHERMGPNRAYIPLLGKENKLRWLNLFGIFHLPADGLKLLWKEDHIPVRASRLLHSLAPFLALLVPLSLFAVIPFGHSISFGKSTYALQIAPGLDVGILYVFAIASLGTYAVTLAGWSSSNKYALLGGLRGAAQMLSYEVAMGLTIIGVLMVFGELRLDALAVAQSSNPMNWGFAVQPLGFILFFVAAVAETKRAPFDMPEGESEIVGFFIEYSGGKFMMFYFAEFMEIVIAAALVTALFFGGWQIPFVSHAALVAKVGPFWSGLLEFGCFWGKVAFFSLIQAWIRWTVPRFRYDQVMRLGWKYLLPLALANIFVTGIFMEVAGKSGQVYLGLVWTAVVLAGVVIFLARPSRPAMEATGHGHH